MIFLKEQVDYSFIRATVKRHRLHPVPLPEQHLLPDYRVDNESGQVVRERYPWGEIVVASDGNGRGLTSICVDDYVDLPEWAWDVMKKGNEKDTLIRPDCLGCYERSFVCDGGWDAKLGRDQPPCPVRGVCKGVQGLSKLYRIPPEDLEPSLTDEELYDLARHQKSDKLVLDDYAIVRPLIERVSELLGERLNLDVWADQKSAGPGDLFLRDGIRGGTYRVTVCRRKTDGSNRWNSVVRIVPKIRLKKLSLFLSADYNLNHIEWPDGVTIKEQKFQWEVRGVSTENYPVVVDALVFLVRKRFISCYNLDEVT